MGQNGAIKIPPAEQLTISSNGSISIVPFGAENAATMLTVDKIKLVKPDLKNIEKGNDGLIYIKDGSVPADNASVQIIQGSIEGSNVSAVGAMVDMIELARNFEMQTNIMKNAKENAAASAKLLQM
jgi:flagellar basal-body rod protein FlgF